MNQSSTMWLQYSNVWTDYLHSVRIPFQTPFQTDPDQN